jgi:U32 family peptidase
LNSPVVQNKKPELLAPAGTIDSFHAAIDAGADAVYVGLEGFNARLRAKNFTAKTLAYLVPYAHARKRKVYVAINTLVQQAELEKCVHLLNRVDGIGADAVIVQDLGVADICRKAFPRLKIHASTQMSIHNSLGVRAAGEMGIGRVVLARELTFDEITGIRKASTVELETFVHGALCYCFSGMCLASSFLGGFSGNRGRCTQVCRRPFLGRERSGQFFSPSDFCALRYIQQYAAIGIDSLKIEGRMKNEEYVFAVVSAYRKAIDEPGSIPSLLSRMEFDLGRKKSEFYLGGVVHEGIIDPSGHSGTGILLGTIKNCDGREIVIETTSAIYSGDSVRIQPTSGFEGTIGRIATVLTREGSCVVTLAAYVECAAGDAVYLTRHAVSANESKAGHDIAEKPAPFDQYYPHVNTLLNSYTLKKNAPQTAISPKLTVIIDDPGWRGLIFPDLVDELVAAYEKNDVEKYFLHDTLAEAWKKKIVVGLPPFIPEADIGFWKQATGIIIQRGIRHFMCANIGQWILFDAPVITDGDFWIWTFNRPAQKALFERGIGRFSYSLEDDYPNMRNSASVQGRATLFSHVPLFISRIRPAAATNEKCRDALGNEFFVTEKHGLFFLVSKKPMCLFHKRKKLEEAGISSFIIDLRFCKPEKNLFKDLLRRYKQEAKIEESVMFNFKLGIR